MFQDKLLPCPFCGSERIYYHSQYPLAFMECHDCECDGPALRDHDEDDLKKFKICSEKWNNRFIRGL
jgi:hypothetical protein